MAKIDKTYHSLLEEILSNGFKYEDPNRKGVHRIQIPSYTIKHDFKDGFPAITTKKLYWKGVVGELLTFLRGSTELKDLHDNQVKFWDKDAFNYYLKRNPKGTKENFEKGIRELNHIAGDLGKIYPYQMRAFGENNIDQIKDLIYTLKTNPLATKKTVTMWNPSDSGEQCLTPCHWSFEILVEPLSISQRNDLFVSIHNCTYDDIKIHTGNSTTLRIDQYLHDMGVPKYQFTLKWHQHSVDTFLGLPMNISYYALLAHIIGKLTNMIPKGIIGDLSNVHIYEPHLDAVKEQLSRDVNKYDNCELLINSEINNILSGNIKGKNIDLNTILNNIGIFDFYLDNYKSYPSIKVEMLAYNK